MYAKMPVTRKKATKKNSEDVLDESSAVIEPVVMQLGISKKRVDHLIRGEESKTTPLPDPVPYSPESQFTAFENPEMYAVLPQTSCCHHDLTCFWCCHKINHIEYGMPIRYDAFHNNFSVFGSFCSLECAAAYNFAVHSGCDRVWEIHSWIQLLGQKYGFELPIRPSPSKYLLKMFNGPMSIDDFRAAHKTLTRTYTVNIPPLIHIANSVECVNTSFLDKVAGTSVSSKKKAVVKADQKMNLFVVQGETT